MNDFWTWAWRPLHALNKMRRDPCWFGGAAEAERIDAGYCLDRYSIEDEGGNVIVCRP